MPFENLEEIKKLVIIALFSDADLMHTLVLKGGNLLDVVYGISSRPSIDIDLSMRGEFAEAEKARASIEKALRNCFSEHVREFHRPDFISVVDTLKPDFNVQTYDYYFDYVAAKCRLLNWST